MRAPCLLGNRPAVLTRAPLRVISSISLPMSFIRRSVGCCPVSAWRTMDRNFMRSPGFWKGYREETNGGRRNRQLEFGTYPEFGGAVDSVAMIVVHHLEKSRSQRILWLLEELGLDYEVRHYKRDPKSSLAPPELLKV